MKSLKIIFVSVLLVIITPLFFQCQKSEIVKSESPTTYLSKDYIENLDILSRTNC